MKFQENIKQRLTGRHKKTFAFVGDVKNKKILDIGCSFGWFEKWAVESKCKQIFGLETKKKLFYDAPKKIPQANYALGSALSLPFEDNSFDIVVSFEVIEHIPKKTETIMFKEINRVLKKDGSFFLSTPNKNFVSCILDPAWWLMGHRHYSHNYFQKLAKETGFVIKKVDYGGDIWEMLGMINLYVCKWLFKREMLLKSWFEKKREKGFLTNGGWTNIFLKFSKNN